jgi:hypothetical protein
MNVTTAWLVAIGLGSGAVLSAQATPRGSSTTAQPGQQASPVTVIGCLQRTNTGVPAAATSVDAGQTTGGAFILANARPSVGTAVTSGGPDASGNTGRSGGAGAVGSTSGTAPSSGSMPPGSRSGTASPTPTTGTAAARAGAAGGQGAVGAARTYTLIESKAGELMSHVGHQIEVTGRFVSAGTGGATGRTGAAGSTSAASSARGSDGAPMANQRVEVTSVMMISPTCPSVQTPATSTTPSR